MDRITVAKIEMGLRSVFDFELVIIARVLGSPTDCLFPDRSSLKEMLPALLDGMVTRTTDPQKKRTPRTKE